MFIPQHFNFYYFNSRFLCIATTTTTIFNFIMVDSFDEMCQFDTKEGIKLKKKSKEKMRVNPTFYSFYPLNGITKTFLLHPAKKILKKFPDTSNV